MIKQDDEIVNPRTGQRMKFLQTGLETNGELLQIECFSPPTNVKEPEHIHPKQESRLEVLSGALYLMVAGQMRVVHAGADIVIPPATPHYFWNEGEEEAHYLQEFRPALHIDEFFETLFGWPRDNKLDEHGMVNTLQLAVSIPRFWNEIRMVQPPELVQRVFVLLVRPIGLLLGYR